MKIKTLLVTLVMCASWEPMSAQVFTTPKAAGYTLLRTGSLGEYKIDHYLEKVRTFRKDNGDFVTYADKYDSDEMPSSSDQSKGDWRVTTDKGEVIYYDAAKSIVTVKSPNGIELTTYDEEAYFNLRTTPLISHYVTPHRECYVKFPNSNKKLVCVRKNAADDGWIGYEGFAELDNNGAPKGRVYQFTYDGELVPVYQIIDNNKYFFANAKDSIISIDIQGKKAAIKYANGDYLIVYKPGMYWWLSEGKMHRNGGVLDIKTVDEDIVSLLTFSNGDKFAGSYDLDSYHLFSSLGGVEGRLLESIYKPELTPYEGTMVKANGKSIQYKYGKSETQIKAEESAATAKATAQYKQLCNQYGQKYVDAALNQIPIVGMPETLLQKAFNLKLVEQGTHSKLYRITGLGWTNFGRTLSDSALLYSVWVSNGRVTSIRHWRN